MILLHHYIKANISRIKMIIEEKALRYFIIEIFQVLLHDLTNNLDYMDSDLIRYFRDEKILPL